LGLKNGSSASTVAFGILSDELDAGDPAIGAESFSEFRASTSIIEEAPPMKLEAHINVLTPTKRIGGKHTVSFHTSLLLRMKIDLTTCHWHHRRHHPVAYPLQDC
jgi:hypothetical protein